MNTRRENVTLGSLFRNLRSMSYGTLRSDVTAALTVALIALPQSMAYALVAGLPPSVGIFAAIFGTIFTAAFGYSRHLVGGPTNTVAVLLQAATSEILYNFYRDVDPVQQQALALHIVVEVSFIVGVLLVIAAVCHVGRLAQFVSRPVVRGYVLGVACAIIINQLFTFTGINQPDGPNSLYYKVMYIATHPSLISPSTLLVGVTSLAILIALKRINRRIPAAAITLIIAAVGVSLLHISDKGVLLVSDFGPIHEIYPRAALPYLNFRILNGVIPFAFAIALLCVIEVTSIVKSLAAQSGQKVAINQEVLGLGIANLFSSFFCAMPSSGSFSRSSVNINSGASTQLAAILSGVCVAILVFVFGRWVGYIPLCALSSLLFVTAITMVDRKQIMLCLKATRSDAVSLAVTFAACLLFSLDIAFFIGVMISIAFYLKKAASPSVREMTIGRRGQARPLVPEEKPLHPQIRIIDVDGELFFGAVDFFQQALETIASDGDVRVVILRLKNAHHLDASTCMALKQLHSYIRGQGQQLILCGLTQHIWPILKRTGLMKEVGQENLFLSDPLDAIGSTGRAFLHAEEMLNPKREPDALCETLATPEPV